MIFVPPKVFTFSYAVSETECLLLKEMFHSSYQDPKTFSGNLRARNATGWLFVRAADFQDQHRSQGRAKSNLSFQLGFQGKPQSLLQLKALPLALWPPSVLLGWLGACLFDKPQLTYRGRQCFANRVQATSPSSFPERQPGFLFYWWGNWDSERQG